MTPEVVSARGTGLAWIEGHRLPVRVDLRWTDADPLAVQFSFAAPGQEGDDVAHWKLCRASIQAALAGRRMPPSSWMGDVTMWTTSGALMLRLDPGTEPAIVQVPGLIVADFLRRAELVVGSGSEMEQKIVDRAVDEFLNVVMKGDEKS
jgi:hypothetical protein